jgi:DNA-binding response OmpR family regulator
MHSIERKKGLEVAKRELPDLIILDVMMPEMDGMETCREIREIPSLQNVVITFLTARNEDYSQIAGFEAGADDFITKPIRQRLLVSKISVGKFNKYPLIISCTCCCQFLTCVIWLVMNIRMRVMYALRY